MDSYEFVKEFGKVYEKVINLLNDDDFFVNEKQMQKFREVYEFFTKAASEYDSDEVEPPELIPREEHGGITASFIVFDIYGESLEEFKKIVQYLSAFGIDATKDGRVRVSVTVPNVFCPKLDINRIK